MALLPETVFGAVDVVVDDDDSIPDEDYPPRRVVSYSCSVPLWNS